MKVTKTLAWFQKHADDDGVLRANVQTTVTDDTTGATIASSGEDLAITDPGVLAAASALEEAVLSFTGSVKPAAV